MKTSMKGLPCADDMARAYHEGRKTQTRRVMRPQPPAGNWRYDGYGRADREDQAADPEDCHWLERLDECGEPTEHYHPTGPCKYGKVGDVLFVAETWWHYKSPEIEMAGFDHMTIVNRNGIGSRPQRNLAFHPREHAIWKRRSAKEMPAWAARTFLRITAIRVERLQEIGEEDAKAEGVSCIALPFGYGLSGYIEGFAFYWDSLAKPGEKWQDSPWVWVIESRRIDHA